MKQQAFLALLVAAGQLPSARAEQSASATVWAVKEGPTTLGTAFVIDKRGYLLTAAHVIGNRTDLTVVSPSFETAKVEKPQTACRTLTNDRRLKASPCIDGDDLALLQIKPSELSHVKKIEAINLDFRVGNIRGEAWGFPADCVEAAVPMASSLTSFSLVQPPRAWSALTSVLPGMSGGPVVSLDRTAAFGVLSWRKYSGLDCSPGTAAYATPIDLARSYVTAIPLSDAVRTLLKDVVNGAVAEKDFARAVGAFTTIELMQFVSELPKNSAGVPVLLEALAKSLRTAVQKWDLEKELSMLGALVESQGDLSGRRDVGTAALIAAERTADGAKKRELGRQAVGSFEKYFTDLKPGPLANPVFVASASAELGKAYALSGDRTKAAEWFATSYLANAQPATTRFLAEHMSNTEKPASLDLYCEAFASGNRAAGVKEGFWDSLTRITTKGLVKNVDLPARRGADISESCTQFQNKALAAGPQPALSLPRGLEMC